MQPSIIGLDLAKHVFQVLGIAADGHVVLRRQLRRSELLKFFRALPPCLAGMEACASAHYCARQQSALGHTVRLMPATFVKPYAKRGKSDAIDAEAISEAVTRPTMRFVPVKSVEQQSVVMLHRTRDLLVRQRTMRQDSGNFRYIISSNLRRRRKHSNVRRERPASMVEPSHPGSGDVL